MYSATATERCLVIVIIASRCNDRMNVVCRN